MSKGPLAPEGGTKTYSITEECAHPDTYLRVLDAVVGCETTVVECMHCGKELTEPKTEC